jgi:hypothetical protein
MQDFTARKTENGFKLEAHNITASKQLAKIMQAMRDTSKNENDDFSVVPLYLVDALVMGGWDVAQVAS